MVEHGEDRRINAQPGSGRISGPDRHLAAVTRSLGWAQESADRGDYADALGWVQAVEATGDLLSPVYRAKRQAWRNALADNLARQGRSRRTAGFLDMRPTRPHVNGPRCGLSRATLVPLAPGGGVVFGGIDMSDIPSVSSRDLRGERSVRPVAKLTREDALADLRAGRVSGAAVLVP